MSSFGAWNWVEVSSGVTAPLPDSLPLGVVLELLPLGEVAELLEPVSSPGAGATGLSA